MIVALRHPQTGRPTLRLAALVAVAMVVAVAIGAYLVIDRSGDRVVITTPNPATVQLNPAADAAINGSATVGGGLVTDSRLNPAADAAINGPAGGDRGLNPAADAARNG